MEVSKPYIQLTQDLGIIAFNGMSKAWVGIDSWVGNHLFFIYFILNEVECVIYFHLYYLQCTKTAPEFTSQVKEYAGIAGEATSKYAADFARYTKVGFNSAQEYAAKNIFV